MSEHAASSAVPSSAAPGPTDLVLPVNPVARRAFLRKGSALGVAVLAGPAFLAACADDDPGLVGGADDTTTTGDAGVGSEPDGDKSEGEAEVIVGDVIDFALTSEEWEGAFGWVTMALHAGVHDGTAVFHIRTDASDEDYATDHELVFVPKMASMDDDDLAGRAYFIEGGVEDQVTVFSSMPGRDDYTPAVRVFDAVWSDDAEPRLLESIEDVDSAEDDGDLEVSDAGVVLNASIVQWGEEHMPVDETREKYLGDGQLLEAPDLDKMEVRFKLNQCYPGNRYIVLDHSLAGPAGNTNTVHSPKLQDGPSEAGATGRTNVFVNGFQSEGPLGGQPSVFDFAAGNVAWSPYWDHYHVKWNDAADVEHVESETQLKELEADGKLEIVPGAPPTNGKLFTVNCPVPILAPNDWSPEGVDVLVES